VGVTQEAQDIFDALARTLPCRWQDRNIVVMDEVVIAAPYKQCAGVDGVDPRAVERVQKVLANEKKKLGLA
jgi:protein LSM12